MNKILVEYDSNNSVEVEKNYIIDNYIGKDMGLGYSVVRTHLDGEHPLMKNIKSNRTYYFTSGSGKFIISGVEYKVKRGDMLTVPKDTLYRFKGKFDAILVSCPAFDPKDDVIYR